MNKEDEQNLVNLIRGLADGLYEKGYESVAEGIKYCLAVYYKEEHEARFLNLKFEEQWSLDKKSITDNKPDFSQSLKQLITDVIAIMYFNFVERANMVQNVVEFFNEYDLGVDDVIFAAQEGNPDSKDVNLNELKNELGIYKEVEPALQSLINLASKYNLLLENNLLRGVINSDKRIEE